MSDKKQVPKKAEKYDPIVEQKAKEKKYVKENKTIAGKTKIVLSAIESNEIARKIGITSDDVLLMLTAKTAIKKIGSKTNLTPEIKTKLRDYELIKTRLSK